VQPALNFAPVKYIIYKGILESSLIDGAETALAGNNRLTQFVSNEQTKKNKSAGTTAKPPAEALGVGLIAATPPIPSDPINDPYHDDQPIDNLFYRTGVSFQLPKVNGGWSIGQFDKAGFGIEVLMEGLNFHHSLSSARKLEHKISVATLTGSENPAKTFDHWHAKEQVLGYMDPCAFYGSFFRAGIQAKTSGNVPFVPKSGNALYQDVLFAFLNKHLSYLDIRNEHNFSFNYFTNYDKFIQLSYDPANAIPAPVDYYASKWPLLTLPASSFPTTNTNKARNAFRIQLPVGDNPQPLLYVSQGYRDINRKRKAFPAELKSAERFYDAFETALGGYTATKNKSGLTSMTFVVPNVTAQSATTPVSCYIRLKYLKQQQQQGTPSISTVIESANYLDNLICPLDLRIHFAGITSTKIKSAVYDEEVYVNAQTVPGLSFDFIGKVGIARDVDNTSFFLVPTNIRTQTKQSSNLISLSGETSDSSGGYPSLMASKYEPERVKKDELLLSATESVAVAGFVSDGDAAASLTLPDFEKLIVIVVANSTYDSWGAKIAAELEDRFRTYLGVDNLQTGTDMAGIPFTSFELVLRGFKLNSNIGAYEVKEINTDPTNNTNVRLYVQNELGSGAQVPPSVQNIIIVPKQINYVLVLNKFGFALNSYPILEFDIKGPSNYIVDVQVARDAPALLTGGPGLANAWDKSQTPKVRMTQFAFSSWTNGDQNVVLDASGNATYRMPLAWWQDLARLPLKDFGTANIHYRAVAWPNTGAAPSAWSTKDGAIAPKVIVRGNLLTFDIIESGANQVIDALGTTDFVDWGYNDIANTKKVLLKFTVREANTTEMYTMVQWKTGSSENWPQPNPPNPEYAIVMDAGDWHWSNDLVPAIDSTDTDPRYPRGTAPQGWQWNPLFDNKTAIHIDVCGGKIPPAFTKGFYARDFDAKLHLNCDVPGIASIERQGTTQRQITVNNVSQIVSVWNLWRLTINPPEPLTVVHKTWKARILQVRRVDGTIDVTHPDTYAGP
jgi:hypothetical protein